MRCFGKFNCKILIYSKLTETFFQVAADPPSGGPHPLPPGCANPPNVSMKLSECCTNLPDTIFNKSAAHKCSETCDKGPEKMCCMTDCVMTEFAIVTDGKFDAVKAKTIVGKILAEKSAWTPAVSCLN